MKARLLLLLCLFSFPLSAAPRELWLYYATNLAVDKNIDTARAIWTRAAAAGYTHVLLTDSKFAKLGEMGKGYFNNVARIKQLAAGLKLQLVPAMFDVGYSNNLLWNDPNLAEGLPVKDQPFVVNGGEARPVNDFQLPAKPSYHDKIVQLDGNVATVKDNPGNARLSYALKLPRFRCYHVSVKIKTDGFTEKPEIHVLGAGGRSLQWCNLGAKKTQDWTEHHVTFNTLDSDAVTLYFGVWGAGKGTLQWKDWKVEEAGLVHVLRRPGAPCVVKNEAGQPLVEGKDYEPIIDPKLGNTPWKGEYDAWHPPVAIKTRLADGTKLLVSWYHPAIIYDGQVSACIEEPKFNELLTDQARRMKATWAAPMYMMSHDEFRTLGWDESCESKHQTPGQMLADNARFCTHLLAGSKVYVWNDMFDPFHNAVKGPYYLVNGPWTDSWEGLDKSVVIVNWNYGKRDDSLKFFADRGHRQLIATYYDNPMERVKDWMQSARKVEGIDGFMYTTWRSDYKALEAFAKLCRE